MYNNSSTSLFDAMTGGRYANNTIGRNTTRKANNDDNFFSRIGKSLENTFGTIGSSLASLVDTNSENKKIEERNKRFKNNLDDIAKQYGYESSNAVWEARDAAKESGDTATVDKIDKEIAPKLQAQSEANMNEANKAAKDWKSYREDSYIGKKVNQDRGKYLGSSIKTLALPAGFVAGANPAGNAALGALEGVADELEQSGFDNFDAARAGENALAGAAGGALVGKLNKGLDAKTIANGGQLLKGSNILSRGANKIVNSGIGRGALSGAAGGALGAGTVSALEGQDIGTGFQNALAGAQSGAVQGAIAGGVFSGAGKIANKISPKTGQALNDTTRAWENWKNSGENFDERLTNTLTSGESPVGEWLQGNTQSKVLNKLGDSVGNRIRNVDNSVKNISKPEDLESVQNYIASRKKGLPPESPAGRATTENYRKAVNDLRSNYSDAELANLMRNSNNAEIRSMVSKAIEEGPITNPALQAKQTQRGYIDQAAEITSYIENQIGGKLENPVTAFELAKSKDPFVFVRGKDGGEYTYDLDSGMITKTNPVTGDQDLIGANTPTKTKNRMADNYNPERDFGELLKKISERSMKLNNIRKRNDPFNYLPDKSWSSDYQAFDDLVSNPKTRKIIDDLGLNTEPKDYQTAAAMTQVLREEGFIPEQNTPTTAKGWLKKAGSRILDDLNNNASLGNRIQDTDPNSPFNARNNQNTNEFPKDIQNMRINDEMTNVPETEIAGASEIVEQTTNPITRETEVYRALSNKLEQPKNQITNKTINEAENILKTSKSSQLRYQAAQELLKQYGTIDKPTAKATNAPETIQKIAKAGITKPGDVERIADSITGSNGEVNKMVQRLVASAKPVNTFDGLEGKNMSQFIDESISRHALNGLREGTAVKSQIEAYLDSLPSRRNGSLTGLDDPMDVMDVVRGLEAEAANYEGRSGNNYGTTTQDKMNAAKVAKEVASLLKDRVFETADVQSALTPETAADLKALAPKNEQWSKYVDEEIMGAKTVQDLRSVQAPWVRAKRIIDNGYTNSITYGGRMGDSAPSLNKNTLLSNLADRTWNSNIAQRGKAKVLDAAANALERTQGRIQSKTPIEVENTANTATATTNGKNPSPAATAVWNMIGRNESETQGDTARTSQYLANATNQANANTIGVPNTSLDATYATDIDNTGAITNQVANTSNSYFPATGDYWTDLIGAAMTSAIDANDSNAFSELYEMYQDALSQQSKNDSSDISNWSSGDRSKYLNVQDALGQIDQLEQAYNQATGGEGGNVLQGNLRSLAANISGGNLDPTAANYNNLAQSIGMGIVKNMINLGVTESDAQRYLQYLPALTDTKEQAATKLATLRQIYQNQAENLYSTYGI